MVYVILLLVAATLIVPFVVGTILANSLRMPDHGWKIGTILFALSAGLLLCITGWPPNLGIDLSGGVILVYEIGEVQQPVGQEGEEAQRDDRNLTEKLVAAVTRRVNPGGVKEVSVRPYGANQIEIIIPRADENELERMKRIVSQSGSLEFRILANTIDHKATIDAALKSPDRILYDADGKIKARWVPIEQGREEDFGSDSRIALRTRPGKYGGEDVLEALVVHDPFNVTGEYLEQARPGVDQTGRPCVNFLFDGKGGGLFAGLTGNNLPDETQDFQRRLGIIMNEALFSAPGIRSTIRERGEISGGFTADEVKEYVDVLNAGSLPATLSQDPISEMVTGPTLGSDTIRKGTFAILTSLVLVLVFMLVYYRFSGLVSCFAMLLNLVLILGIMILVKADFTLTGIAGLVLTVGMAVDANVLIFERIREELARGAALRMAIRNGFSKATTTIVDANLTTLLTATILFAFSTEQIQGFAIVLWIGIVTSMFTAVFCSRVVFDIAEKQKWITSLNMMQLVGKTNVDFIGMRYAAAMGSLALITVGLIAVVMRGPSLLDIDFTGGTSVCILFDEPVEVGTVRSDLHDPLPDLAVNYVQLEGEERGLRYMINTSMPKPEEVKTVLREVYGDRLAANDMTVEDVKPFSQTKPPASPEDAPKSEVPPEPEDDKQSNLRPYPARYGNAVLLFMAQADAEKPASEAEPAAEPAETPPAEVEAEEEPAADKPEATPPAAEAPAQPAEEAKPAEAEAAPDGEAAKAETPEPEETEPAKSEKSEQSETPSMSAAEPQLVSPFVGGATATLKFAEPVNYQTIDTLFKSEFEQTGAVTGPVDYEARGEGVAEGESTPTKTWDITIALPPEKAKAFLDSISEQLGEKPHFPSASAIGGRVAGEMQEMALVAMIGSFFGIVAYIWIRFQRVAYGLAAVVALVHDVLVTLGALAISWYVADLLGFLGIQQFKISLSVLAAFLTIIGYSLNDTIVVFDRIREVKGKSHDLTGEMINTSINQTLSRTLLTSLTTLIVVVILYIFGGQGIHAFAFSLVVGVVVGTYSSVFVASPVLYWMSRPAVKAAVAAKNGGTVKGATQR